MKNKTKYATGAMGIILLSLLFIGCDHGTENIESEARSVYDQAENLWQIGKEAEALLLYDKIAKEYPQTEIAQKLEKEMPLRNLMYGSAAHSWTDTKLFDVENQLIEVYRETGEFPSAMETPLDGWKTRIVYKFAKSKDLAFDFLVISAGPDRRLNTPDDLRLVHAKDPSLKARQGVSAPGGRRTSASEVTIHELDQGLDSLSDGDRTDREVSLKALGKDTLKEGGLAGKNNEPEVKDIELEDLLKGNF